MNLLQKKFTLLLYAQRFYGILCISVAKEWTYPQGYENTGKIISHILVFLANFGVLQTFSTNQTAANKQGIHGLLKSVP